MSRPGDVVWSRGRAWLCRNDYFGGAGKLWWMACTEAVCEALAYLREHDDFRWLVKDGKRVVHADDCPPQVAYEAYQFQISNLMELLAKAEEDNAALEARVEAAVKAREMFQDDYDKVVADRNLVINELAAMTKMRDAARKDAQEAVAGHEKLVEYYTVDFPRRMSNNKELRDLRQRCSDLGEENEQLSSALNDERRVGRQEERAAIVKWLNEDPQGWVRHWSLAGRIERGVHLGGNDE